MSVDTLNATNWDVLIAGTGLHESLLALSLSRSGKKILHVDKNDYYGGGNAALSLEDAEDWASHHSGEDARSSFANASVHKSPVTSASNDEIPSQLSFSRAYSLALSPQLLYAQSTILPTLVSSKVDQQLDFLAVGSCFVFARDGDTQAPQADLSATNGRLVRVPNSREDVFADESLLPKHKRGLMKFLRFISDFEKQRELWEPIQSEPFDEFLLGQFNLSTEVQRPLHALTLSPSLPQQTATSFALPRIARHLRSIGIFGPGFGSVIPKWGGLAEIAQVGCRACAVGGGVYSLGNGLEKLQLSSRAAEASLPDDGDAKPLQVRLRKGEFVTTDWIVAAEDNNIMPQIPVLGLSHGEQIFPDNMNRSISIVSSSLKELFPQLVDNAPIPAAAIIVVPSSSLVTEHSNHDSAPIHIMIHSSDTGECPEGQSVLYASVPSNVEMASSLLDKAVTAVLQSVGEEPTPHILWKLEYEQRSQLVVPSDTADADADLVDRMIIFPPSPQDLAFDDAVMRRVRNAWLRIMGDDSGDFMTFAAREGAAAEEDE